MSLLEPHARGASSHGSGQYYEIADTQRKRTGGGARRSAARRAASVGGARRSAAGRLRVAAHGIMKLLMECGAGTQRRSAVGSFGRRRPVQCGTVRRGRRWSAAHGTVWRGLTAAARRRALWRRPDCVFPKYNTQNTSSQPTTQIQSNYTNPVKSESRPTLPLPYFQYLSSLPFCIWVGNLQLGGPALKYFKCNLKNILHFFL